MTDQDVARHNKIRHCRHPQLLREGISPPPEYASRQKALMPMSVEAIASLHVADADVGLVL